MGNRSRVNKMGVLYADNFSDELLQEFKEILVKKYGRVYGNITPTVEEAIKDWIKKQKRKQGRSPTPTESGEQIQR